MTELIKKTKRSFLELEILLATGGEPRKLGVLGEDMEGVTTIRNITQANLIHKEAAK